MHLSQKIWHEEDFNLALADYEEAYSNYFSVYCDCILAEAEGREVSTRPLLMFLKKEAAKKRSELISARYNVGPQLVIASRPRRRRFGTRKSQRLDPGPRGRSGT